MGTDKPKVVYYPKADLFIFKLALYIKDNGYPDTAIKIIESFYDFGDSLSVFPDKYPICKQKSLATKKMRCAVYMENYIYAYKVVKNELRVYNVIHSKRHSGNFKA